jgi:hypothetical protein
VFYFAIQCNLLLAFIKCLLFLILISEFYHCSEHRKFRHRALVEEEVHIDIRGDGPATDEKLELLEELQLKISRLTERATLQFGQDSVGNKYDDINENRKNKEKEDHSPFKDLLNFMDYSFEIETKYTVEVVKLLSFKVNTNRKKSPRGSPQNINPNRQHRDLSAGKSPKKIMIQNSKLAKAKVIIHLVAAVDTDGDVTVMCV